MADDIQANPTQANANTQQDGGQQSVQTQATTPTQGKTFTQDELEAIISQRLAREKSKYADYDALKAKAEQLESANKSELEKAVEKANKAEARAKEIEREAKQKTLRADATTLAVALGFDAKKMQHTMRLVEINDDSTADTLKTSLETLAKEMPELLTKQTAPTNTGASNPARSDGTQTETREQRLARIRSGSGNFDAWLASGQVVFDPEVNRKQQ